MAASLTLLSAAKDVLSSSLAATTVQTSFGKLIGTHNVLNRCEKFLGIPFAKPPVGELRFEDPVAWDDAYPAAGRKATSYGAFCPQLTGGDEDCLFLNIWRPNKFGDLAAMVWIHGGAFVEGAGSQAAPGLPEFLNMYDGCGMAAQQGVIVASMNYRMGPLGFGAFMGDGKASGNFGMKDQRQAMLWLQQQLPAFGGDPSKMTIFGESAGGISVFYHVVSPASKGLFRGAISESGFPAAWGWEYGKNITSDFAAKLNCTEPTRLKACLRDKSAKELIANAGEAANPFTSSGWSPVVDGSDMPKYPASLYDTKETNGVPMMVGSNTDEANLFVWPFYEKGMSQEQFDKFIPNVLSAHDPVQSLNETELATLLDLYSTSNSDMREVAAQIVTDATFQCGTRFSAQDYTDNDVWLYRFNHRSSCQFWLKGLVPGVYHASELQYVWNSQPKLGCVFTPAERKLAKSMQLMWGNFAKCLDPTQCGTSPTTDFPKHSMESPKALVLQTPEFEVEEDYRGDVCRVWKEISFNKYKGKSGGPVASVPVVV